MTTRGVTGRGMALAAALLAGCSVFGGGGLRPSSGLTLPIIELPARANRPAAPDVFVVMLSGDGGWRTIDEKITDRLRADGFSVVGFDTRAYYETRRTPEESSAALAEVIRMYSRMWQRNDVILVGYSRGADVLPFMVSRLPADLRAHIREVTLLGVEGTIDFKYHVSWIPFYHPHEPQFPVLPEIEKLRGLRMLCVYGDREKQSICPSIDPRLASPVGEKGSHHFGGHYDAVADAIEKRLASD